MCVLTSVFCMCSIFTAASASVVYLSFGGIPTDYAILTFFVGLIFTIIGQVILHRTCVCLASIPLQ